MPWRVTFKFLRGRSTLLGLQHSIRARVKSWIRLIHAGEYLYTIGKPILYNPVCPGIEIVISFRHLVPIWQNMSLKICREQLLVLFGSPWGLADHLLHHKCSRQPWPTSKRLLPTLNAPEANEKAKLALK